MTEDRIPYTTTNEGQSSILSEERLKEIERAYERVPKPDFLKDVGLAFQLASHMPDLIAALRAAQERVGELERELDQVGKENERLIHYPKETEKQRFVREMSESIEQAKCDSAEFTKGWKESSNESRHDIRASDCG